MRRILWLLPVAALALMPISATAQSLFGLEVFGAFSTHNMDDANDAITVLGGDEVSNSLGGGISARMWATPNFLFNLTWEPIFVEEDVPGGTINLDANSFQVGAAYFFPTTATTSPFAAMRLGLGAGIGYYILGGEASGGGLTEDIEGNGIGFHVLGMAEFPVSPGFAITAGAGYRIADIEPDDAIGDETIDYSGFTGRLGVAFYLPGSTGTAGY